nr:GAF domain-containing protein [Actinoplanes sp. N902-109]
MSHAPHETAAEHQLLQSVVAVARHVYAAAASSVFMVDPQTGELIFAAVAGAGQQSLVGRRFPPGTGIAGWVTASFQSLITDVSENDHFARDAAESTGYLPSSIMAAPLVADGDCIGVLEVLDRRGSATDRDLDDMELLNLVAAQAALSLALLRRREQAFASPPPMGSLLARLTEHAAMDSSDPLAVMLIGLSLDLLDRRAPLSH